MPHFNRLLGQYRATFHSPAFPELEAAVRAGYPLDRGYSVTAAKGKREWCILAHRGLTTGFRIDFVPVPAPFGPPEVEVRVHRSSRLLQLAYYLMAGVLSCVIAGFYLGQFMGWWAAANLIFLLVGVLLGFALFLAVPTVAGLCMHIGGRLSDDELTAIGQRVGEAVERAGGVQRP
jgi:hypothetical protein